MKIFKKILVILFDLFIGLQLILGILNITSYCKQGYASIAGYTVVEVLSPSMTASNITPGNYYLIKTKDSYDVGDIVAFKHQDEIIFHQIIEKTSDDVIQTKGSSNTVADPYTITSSDIIGSYLGLNVTYIFSPVAQIILICFSYLCVMYILIELFLEIKHDNTETNKLEKDIKLPRRIVKKSNVKYLVYFLIFAAISITTVSRVYCASIQNTNFSGAAAYDYIAEASSQEVTVTPLVIDINNFGGKNDGLTKWELAAIGSKKNKVFYTYSDDTNGQYIKNHSTTLDDTSFVVKSTIKKTGSSYYCTREFWVYSGDISSYSDNQKVYPVIYYISEGILQSNYAWTVTAESYGDMSVVSGRFVLSTWEVVGSL